MVSIAISIWADWDASGPNPAQLAVPCGHLDRAEAAAAGGDIAAAEHFFALADAQVREAIDLVVMVNASSDADGASRLREIAVLLSAGDPEPARGWALVFRHLEGGAEISVWLRLGPVGPETGALCDTVVRRLPA